MRFPLPFLLLGAMLPGLLPAVQTGVLVDEGYAEFFQGELHNVSLSRAGELGTAPRLEEVVRLDEPSVWEVIPDGEGSFILGTGLEGKVLRLSPDGTVTELFAPDAMLARGLARDEEGNLYVGTSPRGAIYRLPAGGGKPELFYDPDAVYVWDLAVHDEALWITTGMPARFLRLPLEEQVEEADVWFEARDEHLTALARRNGEWLLGSSPRGIVYAISQKDAARAIFKADQDEIRALLPDADGSLLIATYSEKGGGGDTEAGELPPFIVRAKDGETRRAGGSGSRRSEGSGEGYLVQLDAQGIARSVWRSSEGGVFALAPIRQGLALLGFSEDGKLFGFASRDSWELLQQMPRGGEVSVIEADPSEPGVFYLFTSNPGAVYRLGGAAEDECRFTSRVLDARQAVTWGHLETTFAAPGAVTIETRSGLTDEPDSTWSDWAPLEEGRIGSPRGRFLQYRLRLPPDSTAQFLRARAFHTMPNAAPVISRMAVLDFGAEIRTAQLNGQMIDFSAAFQGPQLERFEGGGVERIKLERRPELTLRTLIWMANDPNGDALSYDVYFRKLGTSSWTVFARELEEPVFVFNAAGMDPGKYRFKVVASDLASNLPDQAQTASRLSELVLLDATAPAVSALGPQQDGRVMAFRAESDISRLVAAQVTVDGGEPVALRPVDGIFDSTVEEFHFPVDRPGPVSVLFEVLDESGNQAALTDEFRAP